MARQEATIEDVLVRAKANGYETGAHKVADEAWGIGKHVKKMMKDWDATLLMLPTMSSSRHGQKSCR